jgi:hypothetical protein
MTVLRLGLILAVTALPAYAEDLPAFAVEFVPSADAATLQSFVRTDYAREAEQPLYRGFTVTTDPGIARLHLPAQFEGTLADLVVATGCLSGAVAPPPTPQGVTFRSDATAAARSECRRWTSASAPTGPKTPTETKP